jgi:6-phosphogluconolactonase
MNKLIFENPEALATAAVKSFEELSLEAISTRGVFNVALAGGSTPKVIYEKLAKTNLPWQQIHFYWGDERCVLPSDSRANFLMVQTALLENIRLPPENIHRVQTELEPEQALESYKHLVQHLQLDLIHLGLGPDGHTASLFPASNLESDAAALLTFPTVGLEPQVQRISLSLQKINEARVKQIFVTGSSKQVIVQQILLGMDFPATRLKDAEWWFDKAALPPS